MNDIETNIINHPCKVLFLGTLSSMAHTYNSILKEEHEKRGA